MEVAGRRIVLRDDERPGDADDLFRWLNLEEWNYYDEPDSPFVPVSREEFEERRSRPKKPVSGAHTWQVDTLAGRHRGWVNYYRLDEAQGYALVGVDLPEPETWGQGYATEALCLLIDYLFREMALAEVRTQTWTGNGRMRRVAAKCGFRVTGYSAHRVPVSVRGEPLEFVHYVLVRSEWPEHLVSE